MTTIDLSSSTNSPAAHVPEDEYVGIWFSSRNVSDDLSKAQSSITSSDWRPDLASKGFGMSGIVPPQFAGVGIVISFASGKINLVSGDGSSSSELTLSGEGKNVISNMDKLKSGVKLNLSVNRKKNTFSVYAYSGKTQTGRAEISTNHIPAEGYLGVTGFSGSGPHRSHRVVITRIRTINLDFKSGTGEGIQKVGEKHEIDMSELLLEDGDDALSQIKDIRKATSILSEYLADTRYRDSSMVRTISDIQGRAQSLQDSINDLRAEIRISFKQSGGKRSSTSGLVGEIKGLEELIRLHAEESASIEHLKENIKVLGEVGTGYGHDPAAVERISVSNKELQDEVSKANLTANLVIGVFGMTVLILGIFMYAKMRQYEKKHFL